MAKINLLPWREELRNQRQNEFFMMVGAGLLTVGLIMTAVHFAYNGMIETQGYRNKFLESEISLLDMQINEIKALENTKNKLISRMEVIQRLQSSRPEIVHMFDQLASTVPDGVHLTGFVQNGSSLTINGEAQSNTRVSAYLRKLEQSPWLKAADLNVIQSKGADVNRFTLQVIQEKHTVSIGSGK